MSPQSVVRFGNIIYICTTFRVCVLSDRANYTQVFKDINSINNSMTQIKQMGYLAPAVEVVEINVEAGFALSNLENIGGENEEQDW